MGLLSRIRGRSQHSGTKADTPCTHAKAKCVDISGGIYQCPTCQLGCIYINGVLTPLTFDNMGDNDKLKVGWGDDGIYRF